MSTHEPTRGRRVVLAAAGAVALALAAAGCAQPPDMELGKVVASPEAPSPEALSPEAPSAEALRPVVPSPEAHRTEPVGPSAHPDERSGGQDGESASEQPQDRSEEQQDDESVPEDESVVPRNGSTVLEIGDSGEVVQALQERLTELGYWVGPIDGRYGFLTDQAVMAFQGWEGLRRDGRAGPETRAALRDATRPAPDADGRLLEVHLAEQVLLVVEDGRTVLALHTSTGSGERYMQPSGNEAVAETPVGDWEISWRIDGWRQSDLGRLYRPVYFHERGIAVHGYPEVPAHPASHGCVRVSMEAMDMLWSEGLVAEGTRVLVV